MRAHMYCIVSSSMFGVIRSSEIPVHHMMYPFVVVTPAMELTACPFKFNS